MKNKSLFFLIVTIFSLVFISACSENNGETNGGKNNDEEINDPLENNVVPDNHEDPNLGEENEAADEHSNSTNNEDELDGQPNETDAEPKTKIVMENDAFRVFEPAPNSEIDNEFIVRGQARIFEAHVGYEFEDGHFILDEGFVMASHGAPEWGDFEITIRFDELSSDHGTLILFEESAKDGERIHQLMIPVKHKK